jgi:hypothetical protein
MAGGASDADILLPQLSAVSVRHRDTAFPALHDNMFAVSRVATGTSLDPGLQQPESDQCTHINLAVVLADTALPFALELHSITQM